MNLYRAMQVVEGLYEPDYEDEITDAWQHLHDTRVAYSLQGWYGRTCVQLLEAGIITDIGGRWSLEVSPSELH